MLPPLVGVAVNVTGVPAQIASEVAAILTEGVIPGTVILTFFIEC